jgi:hypothetical protein
MYYQIPRIIIEIISAVACIILLKFMIKPYSVTREGRYIGLPIGFGFLGASYIMSAVAYAQPDFYASGLKWVQLLARAFSFLFLAVAYYFSKKPSKNSRLIWDITFSLLFVCLASLLIVVFIAPEAALGNFESYRIVNIFVRALNIVCLSYIVVHCFRENQKEHDKMSILILTGYVLLGISQVSYLLYVLYNVFDATFWISLTLRLAGLAVFLVMAYYTFHQFRKRH